MQTHTHTYYLYLERELIEGGNKGWCQKKSNLRQTVWLAFSQSFRIMFTQKLELEIEICILGIESGVRFAE